MTMMLGIETSCDETSAAVLEGSGDDVRQKSLVILSQDVHRIYGGVVPEIASRAHLTSIVPVVERAIEEAGATLDEIDAVAVTHAPGLVGALLVGMSYGKALAYSRDIPLLGIHHMEGHLFAAALEHRDAVPPFAALLVSGGHTMLLDVEEWGKYRLLGATRDDAAGEAFDKVEASWTALSRRQVCRRAGARRRSEAVSVRPADAAPECAPSRRRLLRIFVQRSQDG